MALLAAAAVLSVAPFVQAAGEVGADLYRDTNDWGGVCKKGKEQSPINILTDETTELPENLVPDIQMPVVTKPIITNTGFTIQIEWDSIVDEEVMPRLPAGGDTITAALRDTSIKLNGTVKVQPIQFHFHSVSEHAVDGALYAAEAHIVTLVAKGERPEWGCDEVWDGGDPNLADCAAVFGVMYKIGETTPAYLKSFITNVPAVAGESVPYEEARFDLQDVLPESDALWTFVGSLTTPTCDEGLRWHVLESLDTITSEDVALFEGVVSDTVGADGVRNAFHVNNRLPQPINTRVVYSSGTTPAESTVSSRETDASATESDESAESEDSADDSMAEKDSALGAAVLSAAAGCAAFAVLVL